jgi:hypothetical protein
MNVRQITGVAVAMYVEECCKAGCGALFAFTEDFHKARLRDRRSFYCPNGHPQGYVGRTVEDALRDEVRSAQKAAESARNALDAERQAHAETERDRRRIVKRVEAGLCINCRRSFENLADHMATEHGAGGHGSLGHIDTALVVHKRNGYAGYVSERRPYYSVRCGAARIPQVRAAARWAEVTCPECRTMPS